MKDFRGKEIKVGQTVAFVSFCRTSASLNLGVVTGLTPKMVWVKEGDREPKLRALDKVCVLDND